MNAIALPAPTLLVLLDQINSRWPQRSKANDGILGDAAHQARTSDHNQGNALDITFDATSGPDLGVLAERLSGDARTHYVIWNRRIRNRQIDGGAWRPYTGESPHTEHLHVSIYPEKREDASPWSSVADAFSSPMPIGASGKEEENHRGLFVVGLGGVIVGAVLWARRST